MQRKLFVLIILFFLISNVSAVCKEGQIDINTASLEELDEIKWVGPTTAQLIINYREDKIFESVDELINVKYITENRLKDIKTRGLACVGDSDKEEADKEENNKKINGEIIENFSKESENAEEDVQIKKENIQPEIINLNSQNPKDIKTENSKEVNKNNYAIYGFAGFCVLLVVLFLVRKKGNKKNEFK